MLVGLTGKHGVGKDVLTDILVKKYGWVKKSMALQCKEYVHQKTGIPMYILDPKTPEDRETRSNTIYSGKTPLQWLDYYNNLKLEKDKLYWLNKSWSGVSKELKKGNNVVISDTRYVWEYNKVHEENGIIIRIDRVVEDKISSTLFHIDRYDLIDAIIDNNHTIENMVEQFFYIIRNIYYS